MFCESHFCHWITLVSMEKIFNRYVFTGSVSSFVSPTLIVGAYGWPGTGTDWSAWTITGVVSDSTQGVIWYTATQTTTSTQHLIRFF